MRVGKGGVSVNQGLAKAALRQAQHERGGRVLLPRARFPQGLGSRRRGNGGLSPDLMGDCPGLLPFLTLPGAYARLGLERPGKTGWPPRRGTLRRGGKSGLHRTGCWVTPRLLRRLNRRPRGRKVAQKHTAAGWKTGRPFPGVAGRQAGGKVEIGR